MVSPNCPFNVKINDESYGVSDFLKAQQVNNCFFIFDHFLSKYFTNVHSVLDKTIFPDLCSFW